MRISPSLHCLRSLRARPRSPRNPTNSRNAARLQTEETQLIVDTHLDLHVAVASERVLTAWSILLQSIASSGRSSFHRKLSVRECTCIDRNQKGRANNLDTLISNQKGRGPQRNPSRSPSCKKVTGTVGNATMRQPGPARFAPASAG